MHHLMCYRVKCYPPPTFRKKTKYKTCQTQNPVSLLLWVASASSNKKNCVSSGHLVSAKTDGENTNERYGRESRDGFQVLSVVKNSCSAAIDEVHPWVRRPGRKEWQPLLVLLHGKILQRSLGKPFVGSQGVRWWSIDETAKAAEQRISRGEPLINDACRHLWEKKVRKKHWDRNPVV